MRNSRVLAVFDEVLHSSRSDMRVVEVAGRGIAAEARCTLAVVADKTRQYLDSGEESARRVLAATDLLIKLGEIEDGLVELWRVRSAGGLDDEPFERELNDIVGRLDEWRGEWNGSY